MRLCQYSWWLSLTSSYWWWCVKCKETSLVLGAVAEYTGLKFGKIYFYPLINRANMTWKIMDSHNFVLTEAFLTRDISYNTVLRCFERQMAYHHIRISARYTGDAGGVRRTVAENQRVHGKRLDALLPHWANQFIKTHPCGSKWKGKKPLWCSTFQGHVLFLGHGWINYHTLHSL